MTLGLKLAPRVAFSACQLPPVYLFNCFGWFFPFLLGFCLPGLSAGSPQRHFSGMPSLPQLALCPLNVRLGQLCAGDGRAAVCLEPHGEAQRGSSGLGTELLAPHLLMAEAMGRGHPWGEQLPALASRAQLRGTPHTLPRKVLALR